MPKESRHQTHERINPALFFQSGECLGRRDRRQGHAAGTEFLLKIPKQCTGGALMAEGFDQDGAALLVQFLFPRHRFQILYLWHIRGGLALGVDSKMLDPDTSIRQKEIGSIRPLLRCAGLVFIETFVLVVDAVEVEEVGDLALLEALDLLSLQRPDFVAADVVIDMPPRS